LAVFLQMTGVLILAAGVPRALHDQDFGIAVLGYVVMRLVLVGQWLRVAASHPEGRRCALRYATAISVLQLAWIGRLAFDGTLGFISFGVLVLGELLVPVWAEAPSRTPWHPGHIAERYGLFTIIVLGESVLSATVGVQRALDGDAMFADLAPVVVGGLLTVFCLWSIYFDLPTERVVAGMRRDFDDRTSWDSFRWGYGHYFVFASAAAVGAGLAVGVDQATHHSELGDFGAGLSITIPVAVFLFAVWVLHVQHKPQNRMRDCIVFAAIAAVLVGSATPEPVLCTGVVLTALLAASAAAARAR
jgi:low temperature requirement protein LtrA